MSSTTKSQFTNDRKQQSDISVKTKKLRAQKFRKVIVSKEVPVLPHQKVKCTSTDKVLYNKRLSKNVGHKYTQSNTEKGIKNCGDFHPKTYDKVISEEEKPEDLSDLAEKNVEQFYRNKNYRQSLTSIDDCNKSPSSVKLLKTITESTENLTIIDETSSQSSHELKSVKEFRKQNYFACHSSHSRLKNKPSTISINNHKCTYRFYLNDRLFPVPINTDHSNNIRCVECNLLYKKSSDNDIPNGMIQAKVSLESEDDVKDVTLLLPVKEPLILKEKRLENIESNEDKIYFGVLRLDYGYSDPISTCPTDSLALRYQKGFKGLKNETDIVYQSSKESDVIVI